MNIRLLKRELKFHAKNIITLTVILGIVVILINALAYLASLQ